MKSIGIITTSHAINYGAVLQAYALLTSVKEANSYNVEIINYCGDEGVAGRYIYRSNDHIKNLIWNVIAFANIKYRKNRKRLIKLFDEFKLERLGIDGPLLKNKEDVEKNLSYDALICGSDQIWNLNLFQDEVYFLRFEDKFPDMKYISYAASIADKMSFDQERYIVQNLCHFDRISVREREAAKRLSFLCGRNVACVVDPVYLLTQEQWSDFADKIQKRIDGEYVLIFMISHADTDQKIIDKLCEKTYLRKVVINLHPIRYCRGDVYISNASPENFVSLIKNASFIITDSFHATSFSIIFNKEFYSIRRTNRNSRIENLFSIFSIPDRYVDISHNIVRTKLDYKSINESILVERSKALEYLNIALE